MISGPVLSGKNLPYYLVLGGNSYILVCAGKIEFRRGDADYIVIDNCFYPMETLEP